MFMIKKEELKVIEKKLEELKEEYSGDKKREICCDCGDCEARNSQIYCGNR